MFVKDCLSQRQLGSEASSPKSQSHMDTPNPVATHIDVDAGPSAPPRKTDCRYKNSSTEGCTKIKLINKAA